MVHFPEYSAPVFFFCFTSVAAITYSCFDTWLWSLNRYSNKNLSFGVVDLGLFPNTAEKFGISLGSFTF